MRVVGVQSLLDKCRVRPLIYRISCRHMFSLAIIISPMKMSLNRELYASELTVFSCTAVRVISKLHCTPVTTGTRPDIVELPKPYANKTKSILF